MTVGISAKQWKEDHDFLVGLNIDRLDDRDIARLTRLFPEDLNPDYPVGISKVVRAENKENLLNIFLGVFPDKMALIDHYLGLDEWKTEGQKDAAIVLMRDAYIHNYESLDFYYCGLTSLPKGIGKLVNLRKLQLSANKITELPESIGELSNLTFLNLNSNSLTNRSFPSSFWKLSLGTLVLNGNNLEEVPKEIAAFSETLKVLGISTDKFDGYQTLNRVTHLCLDVSGLDRVPNYVRSMASLRFIYIPKNWELENKLNPEYTVKWVHDFYRYLASMP